MQGSHDPTWPDKAMFAALLLILAGALGTVFELVRGSIAVDSERLPQTFADEISGYVLGLSVATLALGIVCLRTQAALWGYLGAATALASVGIFGLVSLLGLAAIVALVMSHLEGEETRNDGRRLHSSQWPDKAMAASLLLFAAAAILVTQAVAIFANRFDPIFTALPRWGAASLDLLVAVLLGWASREVYHLRRPGIGQLAGVLGIFTFGLYVLGPILCAVALLLVALGRREGEFTPRATAPPPTAAKGKAQA